MRGLSSISSFFGMSSNKFNNAKARMFNYFYHMTLRLLFSFLSLNVIILSLCTQRCKRRHNVSRKSVNHWWFIDFIAWRDITPRRDVM